ncbi:PAS domain S-box protein [Pseudalkalibacillus caeni]|uniref:PAS domain S-box protein n=1 Tax=Exobacillus caeni TaxID=2574798 RepID=A0A5R9F6X7_9BACL|nr:PAS domain S-box protein [Pseudalkalibacillus caeni]TLS36244.1 PAS domain S-box protein [Pseudalkalibacillus caeni]
MIEEENGKTVINEEDMYRQIVEYSFETTIIHADHKVLYINQSGADFLKAEKEDIIGGSVLEVFLNEDLDYIKERIRKASKENQVGELIELKVRRLDGLEVDVELYCHPCKFGDKDAIQSILRDITSRKEAEKKLKQVMTEISTPVVPVSEGIAVVPLVGEINQSQAQHLTRSIPSKLQNKNLDYLIIDFSGTYNIDNIVANFLYRISSILTLLDISPVITGLRPELAQKAVLHGNDLSSITAIQTVQQALRKLTRP